MLKTTITTAALLLAGSTLAGCDLDFAEMEDYDKTYHAEYSGGDHHDRSYRSRDDDRGDHDGLRERSREHRFSD